MANLTFICHKCGNKTTGASYVYKNKKYCYDCYTLLSQELETEESQKQALYQYIKKLFKVTELPGEVVGAITRELNDNKKLKGMELTLRYYYEIEGNIPTLPAQVIYVIRDYYDEAKKYYQRARELREKNDQVDLNVPSVTVKLRLEDLDTKKEDYSYKMEDL